MLRKVLKAVGWTAASLVGLVVVLYLAALAINWRDREPSAAAKQLTQVSHDRPAVAEKSNGYVYVRQWKLDPDRRFKLSERLQEFLKHCGPSRPECAAEFDGAADELYAEWTAADSTLLDGYMALTAHTGWREDGALSVEASIPTYSGASEGQRMLLMRARDLAKQGDATAVRTLLERDLQFWRTVLQSSDILITKMIATVALNRNFEWGYVVLRSLPAARQAAAIPAGWRDAISNNERSMERCMAGEWLFASNAIRGAPAESFGVDPTNTVARAVNWLLVPLYQEQDTINRYAEHYLSLARAFEVPLDSYPHVVAEVQERERKLEEELFPFAPVYNLLGSWTFALTLITTDTIEYAVRVGDIEGVRRAALTAATLRASGVEAKDVAAALGSAEQRDPYTNQPFKWDDATRAIVFRGLQSGERGEHRIYY
jgi:hypothetical protein